MPKLNTARTRLNLAAGLVLALAVILGVIFTRSSKPPEITAMDPAEMTEQSPWSNYRCNDGSQVIARYSQTADSSISFAELELDGKRYRLDQQPSASGARYSDGQRQWWTKEQGVLLTRKAASASTPQETSQPADAIIEGATVECQQATDTP